MELKEIINGLLWAVMYMRNELGHAEGTAGLEPVVEIRDAAQAAIALLTPRVLTLDELPGHDGAMWLEYVTGYKPHWVFFEFTNEHGAVFTRAGGKLDYENGEWVMKAIQWPLGGYGRTWRCWSQHPTDEQRKAVEWDD